MTRYRGLIAATFTPMHQDGSLRLDRVPAVVDLLLANGVTGLYVCGSTGEGPLLTSAERRAVAEAYVGATAGRMPVIVQVGHASLAEARDLAAHAAAAGADAISATPPTYFKPDGLGGVVEAIAEVASAAPELPFFYYHIPPITGVPVDVAAMLPLAAERVPNLAGVKFSAPQVFEFATLDLERFNVLFGVDEMMLSGAVAGAHGAVGSTYNLIPRPYLEALEALERGDAVLATARQRLATRIVARLVRPRSLPSLKAAMALTGLELGPTRAPLKPLDAGEFAALRSDLEAAGWLEHFAG